MSSLPRLFQTGAVLTAAHCNRLSGRHSFFLRISCRSLICSFHSEFVQHKRHHFLKNGREPERCEPYLIRHITEPPSRLPQVSISLIIPHRPAGEAGGRGIDRRSRTCYFPACLLYRKQEPNLLLFTLVVNGRHYSKFPLRFTPSHGPARQISSPTRLY